MGSNKPLQEELAKQGIYSARDYAKKFNHPGPGTVDRYINSEQSPITNTGNWRSAPLKIAGSLNVPIEQLFPEAAEERQQILDDISNKAVGDGTLMTLLHTVRCPKTAEEGGRAIFVMVDLTCASCTYKKELTGSKLVCTHPKAGTY